MKSENNNDNNNNNITNNNFYEKESPLITSNKIALSKFEYDFDDLNTNNHLLEIQKNIDLSDNEKYSENMSLLLNAISIIISGICQFHFKLTKMMCPGSYEEYSFCFWRYFFSAIVNGAIMKYKHTSTIEFSKLKSNPWFWVRTIDQFIVFETFLFTIKYFRASTASCFVTMSPAVILILSWLFLGEKFYMRYVYGIIICFIGSVCLLSNEGDAKKSGVIAESGKSSFYIMVIGTFWGILQLISVAFHRVSTKMLVKQGIGQDTQIMYTCYITSFISVIFLIFSWIPLSINLFFVGNIFINAVLYIIFTRLLVISLKGVDLSKTTPIGYLAIVTVFILGALFLKEIIHFSDVFGSLLILGFNIYNSVYPVKNN